MPSLRKSLLVVPSDTPEPNQARERVSLFNVDGSPFTGVSGASVKRLYSLIYNDPGSNYAELTGQPFGSTSNPFIGNVAVFYVDPTELSPALDQTKILSHYISPDLETDPNTSGVKKNDWLSTFGPGVLRTTLDVYANINGSTPSRLVGYFEAASPDWNPLGYEYTTWETPQISSGDTITFRQTKDIRIFDEWESDLVGFYAHFGFDAAETYKLKRLRVFTDFIPV